MAIDLPPSPKSNEQVLDSTEGLFRRAWYRFLMQVRDVLRQVITTVESLDTRLSDVENETAVSVEVLTESERDLLSPLDAGRVIFNTDSGTFQGWDGSVWQELS